MSLFHADVPALADAATAMLRPVRPDDAAALGALVEALSPHDRRWRFHGAVNGVSADGLRDMACIDRRRAWAVVVEAGPPGRQRLVADARYVLDDGGTTAEFALMVAAPWRRHGLGLQLLQALRHAAARHRLTVLHGAVCHDNEPMLALLRHADFECEPHPGDRGLVLARSGPLGPPAAWPRLPAMRPGALYVPFFHRPARPHPHP